MLTTKLFCGNCLAMMIGESGQKSNGNIYRYYKCAGAKKHVCDKKTVRKEWIEDIALQLTMKILMSDEDLQKIADRIMELQKSENTLIPALERQLEDVRVSIDNILKTIEMGVCTRSTKARLEELESEEERIKGDICREQLDSRLVTEDQIWYIFDKFRQMDLSMPKQRQRLLDSFLQSIVLFDDKLIISFNYRSQPVTIMLDQLVDFINGSGSDLVSAASPNWTRRTHKDRLPRRCYHRCRLNLCPVILSDQGITKKAIAFRRSPFFILFFSFPYLFSPFEPIYLIRGIFLPLSVRE